MNKYEYMKIGFTGTRKGMTSDQKEVFKREIFRLKPDEFHHGDCVGSDAEAHDIIVELLPNIECYIHPCNLKDLRAFRDGKFIFPEMPPLKRNHDIVDSTDLLIATPSSGYEVLHSGTWATIRYARKQKKEVIIIDPNGTSTDYITEDE